MTDQEFDILDELYFVNSFEALEQELELPESTLREHLKAMYHKGWVRCMYPETEKDVEELPVDDSQYRNYIYLATKAGLLAHNRG